MRTLIICGALASKRLALHHRYSRLNAPQDESAQSNPGTRDRARSQVNSGSSISSTGLKVVSGDGNFRSPPSEPRASTGLPSAIGTAKARCGRWISGRYEAAGVAQVRTKAKPVAGQSATPRRRLHTRTLI